MYSGGQAANATVGTAMSVGNGLRSGWNFWFDRTAIISGAQGKLAQAKIDLAKWEKKLAATKKIVKAAGVDFSEEGQFGVTYTRVAVKNDCSSILQECSLKIIHSKFLIQEYTGWIATLTSGGDKTTDILLLNHDDVLFFFGGIKNAPKPVARTKAAPKKPTVKAKSPQTALPIKSLKAAGLDFSGAKSTPGPVAQTTSDVGKDTKKI